MVKKATLLALVGAVLLWVGGAAQAATGDARVRFVNTAPGQPALDVVVVGGPMLVRDLVYPASSPYLSVAPASYDIDIRATGPTNVLVRVTGWQALAGVQTTVKIVNSSDGHLNVQPMTDLSFTGFHARGAPFFGLLLVLLGSTALAFGPAVYVAEGKRGRRSKAQHRIRKRGRHTITPRALAQVPTTAPILQPPGEPAVAHPQMTAPVLPPPTPESLGEPVEEPPATRTTGVGRVLVTAGVFWIVDRIIKASV